MNAKVQEFINKMKEEQRVKDLKERSEHLISLGLVDEGKSKIVTKQYLDNYVYGAKLDGPKNKYYIEGEGYPAIEVTEDEYQEILKYAPIRIKETEEIKTSTPNTPWASTIKFIANFLLVINIIGGFILCIILSSSYSTDDFAWLPIVSAVTYGILWYPLIVGFSKIVKVAEKTLQE